MTMTRAELEQVRAVLVSTEDFDCQCDGGDEMCHDCGALREALDILNAALAKPEAREWRVKVIRKDGTRFTNWRANSFEDATEMAAPHKTNYECVIESRTPAGPWERAE